MPKVGYRSAVAIPTRAVWPARRRSAARMSGLWRRRSAGTPTAMWVGGTGMGFGSASSFWSAVGFFPISTPRVFTSLERPTRSGGTAASEAAWMLRARERSSSDEIPFSVRERVSSRICFWLARFFSALSSCIWSARTPMYARATSAMSVTRTSRWSSSVASYVASSASICRATRPKTSSFAHVGADGRHRPGLEAREEVVLGARSAADADGRYRPPSRSRGARGPR